jgi:hypothetical protein
MSGGVITRYTRYADPYRSGTVNLTDFNRLVASFGRPSDFWPTPAEWDALAAAGTRSTRFLIRDSTLFVQGTSESDRIVINARNLRQMRQQFADQLVERVWVDGLDGNDRVLVSVALSSTVYGGLGRDTLVGGSQTDFIMGGDGNDLLRGGKGNDTLYGEAGNDVLRGLDGNDMLYSGTGSDNVFGGRGDDSFSCADGMGSRDRIIGEAGFDQIITSDSDDIQRLGRQ